MSGTVIVEGRGKVFADPDTVVIEGEVEFLADVYDEAVAGCASSVEAVRESLVDMGVETGSIRTSGSSVRPNYRDEDLIGYRCCHRMTITLPIGSGVADRAFSTLSAGGRSSFHMNYIVSDPTPYYSQALSMAVNDAKMKATQLASDAGVELGDICEIRYGSDGCRPMIMRAAQMGGGTPEAVEFGESVLMTWSIR